MTDNKLRLKLHALIMRINALYHDGAEYSSMKKELALFLKHIKAVFEISGQVFVHHHVHLEWCLNDKHYSDANAELFFQAVKHYNIVEDFEGFGESNDTIYRALEALSILEHKNTLDVVFGLYEFKELCHERSMRMNIADQMWKNREDFEKLNMIIKLCKSKIN